MGRTWVRQKWVRYESEHNLHSRINNLQVKAEKELKQIQTWSGIHPDMTRHNTLFIELIKPTREQAIVSM